MPGCVCMCVYSSQLFIHVSRCLCMCVCVCVRVCVCNLLPWLRSTLRWPQGLHYTSPGHKAGPWKHTDTHTQKDTHIKGQSVHLVPGIRNPSHLMCLLNNLCRTSPRSTQHTSMYWIKRSLSLCMCVCVCVSVREWVRSHFTSLYGWTGGLVWPWLHR